MMDSTLFEAFRINSDIATLDAIDDDIYKDVSINTISLFPNTSNIIYIAIDDILYPNIDGD